MILIPRRLAVAEMKGISAGNIFCAVTYFRCITLLCLKPTALGRTQSKALSLRRDPFLLGLEAEAKKVLQEVLTGPTKDHEVTLLVEDEVKKTTDVDDLVRSLPVPVLLLRPPQEMVKKPLERRDIPAVTSR